MKRPSRQGSSRSEPAREETRRRILDVAARLFRQHGYAGVSLRAIAAAAGMQAGSLYYHFANKEDLVVAILDEGIRSVHQEVAAAVTASETAGTAGNGRLLLQGAIRAHLTSLLRRSDYTSANVRIFGQLPAAVRKRSLPVRQAYDDFWDQLLGRLRSDGAIDRRVEPREARLLLIGALNATLDWFDVRRGGLEALSERYAALLWNGLGPREEALS